MKRRSFLRHTTHSLALPAVIGSLSLDTKAKALKHLTRLANESDRVLVLIYLEGGNDGLNTVIPLEHLSALNALRPHVILPENKLLAIPNTSLALHPSLPGFKNLLNNGKLKIIQNVGYPDQNFSHFRSTDIWMSGSDAHQVVNSGWAGRHLNHEYPNYPEEFPNEDMPDPLSIEIGFGSSLLFQGPTASMSMVINNTDAFYDLVNNTEEEAPDTKAGDKLSYIRLVARQSQQYGQVVRNAADNVSRQEAYPDTYLAQQLKIVSRLIAGGLKTPIYMVRLGGFDTHDAQVNSGDHTTGEHTNLLRTLDEAVIAFMKDLQFLGLEDRVVGMTFSEFGRRVVSNASLGTDHGSAAPLTVFGNAVKNGVLGDNPEIDAAMTYEDNLSIQYDFRQVYASILQQWFELDDDALESILLDQFDTLPIIGDDQAVITSIDNSLNKDIFSIFPNPVNGMANLSITSDGKPFSIKLFDLKGQLIQDIYHGNLPAGYHTIPWETYNLKAGRYFVVYQNKDLRRSKSIIKK